MNTTDLVVLIILMASAISSIAYFAVEIWKSKKDLRVTNRVNSILDEAHRIHKDFGNACSEVSIKIKTKIDRSAARKIVEMKRGYIIDDHVMIYVSVEGDWNIPSIGNRK